MLRGIAALSIIALLVPLVAIPVGAAADGGFDDVPLSHPFVSAITWLADEGITRGCNPSQGNTKFCPDDVVTRGQMAAFLTRAFGYTDQGTKDFIDDDDSIFEADIEKLATAGVTRGCNPSGGNTKFCPDNVVTRGQMAAFLVRAFGYTDQGSKDFVDDDDSIFQADIEKLAAAGVTVGCNPSGGNTKFCPDNPVTRGQMAVFLYRAFGSPPLPNPGDTVNCGDFATQAEAQDWHDLYFAWYGDIANLDGDANGVACESLP